MTNEQKLDATKQEFLDAQREIEQLRQAIADANRLAKSYHAERRT